MLLDRSVQIMNEVFKTLLFIIIEEKQIHYKLKYLFSVHITNSNKL